MEEGSGGRRRNAREVLFLVTVWFKGIDGLLELVGGMAHFAASPGLILHVVRFLTQDEITEDPRSRPLGVAVCSRPADRNFQQDRGPSLHSTALSNLSLRRKTVIPAPHHESSASRAARRSSPARAY